MSDVECPYCGADVEINHDDGYGYTEDCLHEQAMSRVRKNIRLHNRDSNALRRTKGRLLEWRSPRV